MSEVEEFPWLKAFARSEDAAERAVFLRVYFDLFETRRAQAESVPESWTQALRACLAKTTSHDAPAPALDGAGVDAALRRGDLDTLISLARDAATRLRADQTEALVARARLLGEAGDARLARAMLARGPVRLEYAPLFLDADAEQRLSLLLAVQRAELGAKHPSARDFDPALVEPLEYAAIAGKGSEFVAALAAALGVPRTLAARLSADPGGEALVVALSALGATRDLGVRVLAARDMSESAGAFPRLHALARLAGQLSAPAARRLISAMAGDAPARAAPAPLPPAREAPTPSPFVRREAAPAPVAVVTPETSKRSAPGIRRP